VPLAVTFLAEFTSLTSFFLLLGAPALAMLTREPQAVMVSVSLVRGLGFGLSGVVTATLSRWQAGKHGDRYGHARLLIPALAVAALAWPR
jgi:hypothetical protein